MESVLPADDAEPDSVVVLIKDLQPLGARRGGETRHHMDLTEASHVGPIPGDDAAATEEVFVCLGLVEAAD